MIDARFHLDRRSATAAGRPIDQDGFAHAATVSGRCRAHGGGGGRRGDIGAAVLCAPGHAALERCAVATLRTLRGGQCAGPLAARPQVDLKAIVVDRELARFHDAVS